MSKVLVENEFGRVELYELAQGLQALSFVHQTGQGSVSLYGGQVLSWQPKNQQPVFWLSKDSQYSVGKAIRGGVPICWPWFGGEVKLANGNIEKASNHGFARQSQWQLVDLKLLSSGVEITLSLAGDKFARQWPTAFELRQKLHFGASFQQTLTIKNLSPGAVEYSAALHSYFCVSAVENSKIPALNKLSFDDKLNGQGLQKSGLNNCSGPMDRIYHSSDSMVIVDEKWQRKIAVTSQNCQQWVLWNPGEVAQTMADIHVQGESEFICLEAANSQWQKIAGHSSVSIGQTVKVAVN
ncbi:MAG: D-hexose-6-phosphate mutarotase [Cognaticolwellia sp.]